MECRRAASLVLLSASAIMVVAGAVLVAFAQYAPLTHLELDIVRMHRDGRVETITARPRSAPFQVVLVGGEVMDWNDTLYLFVSWILTPEDWRPQVNMTVDAYVQLLRGDEVVVGRRRVGDTYYFAKVVESGSRDAAYEPVTITPDWLLSGLGYRDISADYGHYTLVLEYVAKGHAVDPYGALHVLDMRLEYALDFDVSEAAPGVYNITGYLHYASLAAQPEEYAFRQSRVAYVQYGAAMLVAGAALMAATYALQLPSAVCRVVGK